MALPLLVGPFLFCSKQKSWERCSAAQPLLVFVGRVAPQSSLKSLTKLGSDVTRNNYSKTPKKGKKNALAVPA